MGKQFVVEVVGCGDVKLPFVTYNKAVFFEDLDKNKVWRKKVEIEGALGGKKVGIEGSSSTEIETIESNDHQPKKNPYP